MKHHFTLFLLVFSLFVYSQPKLKLDNNLAGIITNSQTNSMGLNFNGNNGLEWKKIVLSSSTAYSNRFNTKLFENELLQRVNLEYDRVRWNSFLSYQYNYSLIRKIDFDGVIGLGGGLKFEQSSITKFSISYSIIYQSTIFSSQDLKEFWRHSVRTKLKFEKPVVSLTLEYYYQPNLFDYRDVIIIGQTKLTIFNNKPFNLVVQDVINYRSLSPVKTIHNLTIGAGYKLQTPRTKK